MGFVACDPRVLAVLPDSTLVLFKAWFPYDRLDRPDRPSRLSKCSDDPDDHIETPPRR